MEFVEVVKEKDVEQQALAALHFLSDKDKEKVLKYIESLALLEKTKNDERSLTQS